MNNEKNDYLLGLDIGTNSVGWAVCDNSYNLLKFNKKTMWGVQLFEGAKNCKDSRIIRTLRKGNSRKSWRREVIQEFFNDEIAKVDSAFFMRLRQSFFRSVDKTLDTKFSLFADKDYTDVDYHKRYRTIHHLIDDLANDKNEHDPRLVYLAVAYIISHRGHFLYDIKKEETDAVLSFDSVNKEFELYIENETDLTFDITDHEGFKRIISNRKLGVTKKTAALKEIVSGQEDQTKRRDAVLKLISGGSVDFHTLFNDGEYSNIEKKSISLAGDFEETENVLAPLIKDEDFEFIIMLKTIFDWGLLAGIMNQDGDESKNNSISSAKVKAYEKYGKDLKKLKSIIKAYLPEKYNEVFKDYPKKDLLNYAAYSGTLSDKGKKVSIPQNPQKLRGTREGFYKYISGVLKEIKEKEINVDVGATIDEILDEIKANAFLIKQKNPDNSRIPYQLYWSELKKILDNAENYLTLLSQLDEHGMSVKEKILMLFEFRIPYYIGPLSRKGLSKYAWVEKKSDDKVYPWNFEKVVDIESSRKAFIERMTCKCTYIFGEDVLPKHSLLYSEYSLLNEINNIRIRSDDKITPIKPEIKNKIFSDLFAESKHPRRITVKKMKEYLRSENIIEESDEIVGIDIDIKTQLKSWHGFRNLIRSGVLSHEQAERIIKYITLFGNEKTLLEQWMRKEFPQISDVDILYILKLKYKEWGRLSKRLLTDIFAIENENGEMINIISAMRNTDNNLMQLLGNDFKYCNEIESINAEYTLINKKSDIEKLDDMYISNAVKRPIIRALEITKELTKIMGDSPKRIFIEMSRGGEKEKKRKASRKEKIIDLYKNCGDDVKVIRSEIENISEERFQSDKLFLYCTQQAKCMYSGEPIVLSELLSNNSRWDIDHIYPQSKVKDDSLNNRVLVNKEINESIKRDKYPVPQEIRSKMRSFWEILLKHELIEQAKYDRLIRSHEFDDAELKGFIARQMVETRQSTKAVASLLKEKHRDKSEIVYVKSGLVSEFRQQFGLVKCRDINDFHHAKDAYLSIVAGNVHHIKYTTNYANYIKENIDKGYNIKKIYESDISRYGETAWIAQNGHSISIVKKMMAKNNIQCTRYAINRGGKLFERNPLSKGNGQFRLKNDERLSIDHYGGYSDLTASYFVLIKHVLSGKTCISIKPIELVFAEKIEKDKEFAKAYFKDKFDIENSQILRKLKINTMLSLDGIRVVIMSKQNLGNRIVLGNAMQLILDPDKESYVKKLAAFVEKRKDNKQYTISPDHDKIYPKKNEELYDMLQDKLSNTFYRTILKSQVKVLQNGREKFCDLSIEEQSCVLMNIIALFKCWRTTTTECDLKLIGGKSQGGKITLNGCISKEKYKSIRIVDQSNTGLFEKISENLLEL